MTHSVIDQLLSFLRSIRPADYTQASVILSGATIGQHTRHTIEIYQGLIGNYEQGSLDYGDRKRDLRIETSPAFAIECLEKIRSSIGLPDKAIQLKNGDESYPSSFSRELFYCDEHAIHHMALIRVGINEMGGYELPDHFGFAPSTIRYKAAQCAR